MDFKGFTEADFEVFEIEGLDPRMEAIKNQVRPKLEQLGTAFTPILTGLTGDDIHFHVAKHARRTVNPPKDTWVAFAANNRGYKKHPHFQIGLWRTHVFIRFAVIHECPEKSQIANVIKSECTDLLKNFPQQFVWSSDHTKPEAFDTFNPELLDRMEKVNKAEFLVGLDIHRQTAISEGVKVIRTIEETFERLAPLYKEINHGLVTMG